MPIPVVDDPLALFGDWLRAAEASEADEANAVCLATVAPDGMPSARMVLLKEATAEGFLFYTNLESRKGSELRATGKAAMCVYWKSLRRQVRVQGTVSQVADAEADAYFLTRPRQTQIGAWASLQSRPLDGRFELERRLAMFAAKYALGHVPRPPYWSGFRLKPERIEFWRHAPFRLHDRLVYERDGEGWRTRWLYP